MVDQAHVAAVGPSAALLFARLCWRTEQSGSWSASIRQLSIETGLPERTVRTAAALLREREWIVTEQTRGYDRTTVWTPLLAGQAHDAVPVTCMVPESADGCAGNVTFDAPESALSSIETVDIEQTPPVAPQPSGTDVALFPAVAALSVVPDPPESDRLTEEFAAFWGHYPRKVGKAKAEQAFRKARRTTPLEPIARGLLAQLPDMQDRDVAYVPHPTTWLNGQRWADEPAHAVNRAASRDVFGNPDTVRGAEELLASWQTPVLGASR
jgi:hypothetical protein